MVWRLHLLIVVVTVFLATVMLPARAAAATMESCTNAFVRAGICATGTTDGRAVDLQGTIKRTRPGRDARPARDRDEPGPRRTLDGPEVTALLEDLCLSSFDCDTRVAGTVADPAPTPEPGTAADVVTIADVARFLPATTGLHAEPDGWAVVGVPANLWLEVTPATVPGELLGRPAEVRFTPIAYRFDYGDGSTRTSATPGSSWADLGQEELTATATSHVYTQRADRQATGTVVYAAEYRFADGPWTAVAGAVSGSTPPQPVLVVVERTALTRPG